jgi:hypothetical protein
LTETFVEMQSDALAGRYSFEVEGRYDVVLGLLLGCTIVLARAEDQATAEHHIAQDWSKSSTEQGQKPEEPELTVSV